VFSNTPPPTFYPLLRPVGLRREQNSSGQSAFGGNKTPSSFFASRQGQEAQKASGARRARRPRRLK